MRDKIRLVSSAGTGYFYTTTKTNVLCRKNGNQKFDPKIRQHVIFKEAKIKYLASKNDFFMRSFLHFIPAFLLNFPHIPPWHFYACL